ncbi:histidine--tRNA ligase [Coprothermobacteraceae bacterium]|nr:histidine--tRNA ligase [Coprothermobacteraceae bacterium]
MVRNPKGMRDLLPPETPRWRRLEVALSYAALLYGYAEIRTPILEFAELFRKGLGDESDVALKEMYEFEDKGGDRLALRPEGTAPVARSVIQHHLHEQGLVRLYYLGPMFRREKPQADRYRQFHQFGIELFGVQQPYGEIEVLLLLKRISNLLSLGLKLKLNSLGCSECRPQYMESLRQYVESVLTEDPERERFLRNPLKLLDSKRPDLTEVKRNAPRIHEYLCNDCKEHFNTAISLAEHLGVSLELDHELARGFDYYTRTVFEGFAVEGGAAVVGGGRYDHLVAYYGGPDVPGIGFAIGLERLLGALQEVPLTAVEPRDSYFLVTTGPELFVSAMAFAERLRDKGIAVALDLRQGKIHKQMRLADRLGYQKVLIMGEDEAQRDEVTLRDMVSGEQLRIKQEVLLGE